MSVVSNRVNKRVVEKNSTDEEIDKKELEINRRLKQKQQFWYDIALNPGKIPQFDIKDLYKYAHDSGVWDMSMSVFGQRRTGKTTVVNDILRQMNEYIGRISIITDTKQNDYWSTLIPEATIYPVEQAAEAIDLILKFQSKIIDDDREGIELNPPGVIQHTLILEDFSHDKGFSRYSDAFAKIYGAGRHFKVCVILITQYPVAVGPFVRSNSDFVIVVKASGKKSVQHIVDDHLNFMPLKAGELLIETTTVNYQCLVVNKFPNVKDNNRVSVYTATVYDDPKDEYGKVIKPKLGDPEWRDIIDNIPIDKYKGNNLLDLKLNIKKKNSRIRSKTNELMENYYDSIDMV